MASGISNRTIAFARCIGVFEGGGVRGAAFAGAYQAALDSGVSFVATAGSSAGSIAAALVAARVAPDAVVGALSKPLRELLRAPEKPPGIGARAALSGSRVFGKSAYRKAAVAISMGSYSSLEIEHWVNSLLRSSLPTAHPQVQFSDLPLPVAILTTDVKKRQPKIWSRRRTPEASVGYAVRCSCSIPFFFQPVAGETSLLVDGGIISNLPVFLARELSDELGEDAPALCFRLVGDGEADRTAPRTMIELGRALVDSVLTGVTDIQLSMSASRQVVSIPTGGIQATDFDLSPDQITSLLENGRRAVVDFIADEQIRIAKGQQVTEPTLKGYREGLLDETAEIIRKARKRILILAGDLSWLQELHVDIFSAIDRGVQVSIVSETSATTDYDRAVRGARAIGARLTEATSGVPVTGTLADPDEPGGLGIIVEKLPAPHGRRLRANLDAGLIRVLANTFAMIEKSGHYVGGPETPQVQPIATDDLIRALREGVEQYRGLEIAVVEVALATVKPLARYLESFKLNRVRTLKDMLGRHGLQNAGRIAGSPWPISPPVIERLKNGDLVVVDGHHRVYDALGDGVGHMRAIVVNNPSSNLPASPVENWGIVQVLKVKKARSERYANYNEREFRPIRIAFAALCDK